MQWLWLSAGLGAGVLLAIPLVAMAVRRESRRVRILERRARATERLAELGMLTGGLAHEIKNPLSTIGLNIQLLQEDLASLSSQDAAGSAIREPIGRLQRRFDSLARETQRLRGTLEDFLRFAGRVKLHRAQADINALVGELVDFFTPQAQTSQIHLRTQLAANPATLWADTSLLKQSLLNILINATQAMIEAEKNSQPSGGNDELIIRTERGRALGQDEFRIHITDTGPGIEPDQLEKIFLPYYSSKKSGTGLGLPTARRIVEEHGGTLTVHSSVGRGTDFIIALPAESRPD